MSAMARRVGLLGGVGVVVLVGCFGGGGFGVGWVAGRMLMWVWLRGGMFRLVRFLRVCRVGWRVIRCRICR